jgi:hypothetical protein
LQCIKTFYAAEVHRIVRQRSLSARRTRTNAIHVGCSVADRRCIAKQDSRWHPVQQSTALIRALNVDRAHDSAFNQQRDFESAKSAAHTTEQNADRAVYRRLALIIVELTNGCDQRAEMARVIFILPKNRNVISASLHHLVRRYTQNRGEFLLDHQILARIRQVSAYIFL